MNGRKRVLAALQRKEPDRVPVLEWAIDKNICKGIVENGDILSVVDKLDLDGINFKADYEKEFISETVYIDEWGCKKKIADHFIDIVIENPIKNLSQCKNYKFPDPHKSKRFKSLEKIIEKFGKDKALIFNTRDIYSDLRDIIGYEESLMALISDRENLGRFLESCIEYNLVLAEIVHKKYGIDILVTTDDIADNRGLIFGPKSYFDFFAPKFEKVIKSFKNLGFYCIKHCDGNIMDVIDHFITSGIDCIDPIDPNGKMDIAYIKRKYGERVCIKGNVNCTTTLVSGTLDDVEESVKYCIKNTAIGGGYILSSSNTIHSGVKVENYLKMIETARKYGNYPINLNC